MAKFTQQLAVAGWIALAVTGSGIFLIWRTLVHTRKAAKAAEDMVCEAKKMTKAAIAATEAARDAIEVTRKSSQAELRAYIHLENIEITGLEPGSTEVPRIAVVLKNHGLTPAYKVRDMGATQVLYSEDAHLTIDDDVPRTNMDIGPSQQLTRTHFLKVATWKQYKDDVFAKRGDLYIFGRVIYEDAFGETRHTNYRAKLFVHKSPEMGIEMVVSAEGNEST